MDQLSAHIDRGWDLAQKGDAAGASACARRALEIDSHSPEVHNLLGYAVALLGDAEEAVEHYRQAIALDETYLEAMLNCAEVLMHPLEEWDDAISMCDDALDYAESNEEIADCLLLKVDALLGKGDIAEAKRTIGLTPEGPFESPAYTFLIGRAHYEVGDFKRATPLIDEAAKAEPPHPDALYYLGLLKDEAGDQKGAIEAFLMSRLRDMSRTPPAWSPTPEAFSNVVRRAIMSLDALLGRYVREAEVYVVDVPGPELVVDGVDPRALLILDTPTNPLGETSARLFIYQRNLERVAPNLEVLEDELISALQREITAVFLGRDPESPPDKKILN